jgi:hypothetical protein
MQNAIRPSFQESTMYKGQYIGHQTIRLGFTHSEGQFKIDELQSS